jgi:uncharacterized membrane protein
MFYWWFLFRIDSKQLAAAIAEAESHTSGEIRIYVAHRKSLEPLADAKAQFEKLGMTNTEQRNGILFYIAPRSRKFAILGDTGIHAKCGPAFWDELAAMMGTAFHEGRLTEGLVRTVKRAGVLLSEHFPKENDDQNELPDSIVRGH